MHLDAFNCWLVTVLPSEAFDHPLKLLRLLMDKLQKFLEVQLMQLTIIKQLHAGTRGGAHAKGMGRKLEQRLSSLRAASESHSDQTDSAPLKLNARMQT